MLSDTENDLLREPPEPPATLVVEWYIGVLACGIHLLELANTIVIEHRGDLASRPRTVGYMWTNPIEIVPGERVGESGEIIGFQRYSRHLSEHLGTNIGYGHDIGSFERYWPPSRKCVRKSCYRDGECHDRENQKLRRKTEHRREEFLERMNVVHRVVCLIVSGSEKKSSLLCLNLEAIGCLNPILKHTPMKTIGLIGGMSFESSASYYQRINELVNARLGGLHSAEIVMWSYDFDRIERLQQEGRWDDAAAILADTTKRLEAAGAEAIGLCTNTMHLCAPAIEAAISVPFIHIADATGERVRDAGVRRVGLLGTRFTMEKDFYKGRLESRYGLDVLVPDEADRETIHRIIYDELCVGTIRPESRAEYRHVIAKLINGGAEVIILGCTEI